MVDQNAYTYDNSIYSSKPYKPPNEPRIFRVTKLICFIFLFDRLCSITFPVTFDDYKYSLSSTP